MRTALKNKQKLKYALYHERQEIYQTDSEGNIVYTEVDGERVPVLEGYSEHFYDKPVDFIGNIMPVGSESYARGNVAIYRAYGIDISAYDALILMNRGELPITESSLIWEWHEPKHVSRTTISSVTPNTMLYPMKRLTVFSRVPEIWKFGMKLRLIGS